MTVQELRIGNYVEESVLGVVTVSTIEPELIWVESKNMKSSHVIESSYYHVDINSITPIPLTREWLLKFGFNSNSPCKDFEDCGMPYYAKHGVLLFYNGNRLKHELCDYMIGYGSMRSGKYHIAMIKWIKYIHQLQNLYFALTGEELTVKE